MFKKLLLWGLCSLCLSTSYAGIVVTGTRVIYPAQQKNVSVQLSNIGDSPALVQAWIDNGDPKMLPEQIKTPFVITPPISRVDAEKGQTLRITHTGEALPQDRESVFYLNVLDIPPKPNAEQGIDNYLQFAIRTRIKLFYRPNFPMASHEAYDKVTWRVEQKQLIADNPTPYFITYNHIELKQGGRTIKVTQPDMVAPFSQQRFALSQSANSSGTVVWSVINDYGAKQDGESRLN